MTYKIPTRLDMGHLRVYFESSYEKTGPFGAKVYWWMCHQYTSPSLMCCHPQCMYMHGWEIFQWHLKRLSWLSMNKTYIIYLASGNSRRFKGNKLLFPFQNKPLYQHALDLILKKYDHVIVVSQYDEILQYAAQRGALSIFMFREYSWSLLFY